MAARTEEQSSAKTTAPDIEGDRSPDIEGDWRLNDYSVRYEKRPPESCCGKKTQNGIATAMRIEATRPPESSGKEKRKPPESSCDAAGGVPKCCGPREVASGGAAAGPTQYAVGCHRCVVQSGLPPSIAYAHQKCWRKNALPVNNLAYVDVHHGMDFNATPVRPRACVRTPTRASADMPHLLPGEFEVRFTKYSVVSDAPALNFLVSFAARLSPFLSQRGQVHFLFSRRGTEQRPMIQILQV